jgi:hypothetical protein
VSTASRVTFRAGRIVIPGCRSKLATGSGSTFTVSCQWKPSARGLVNLSATSLPIDTSISGSNSPTLSIGVQNRSNKR